MMGQRMSTNCKQSLNFALQKLTDVVLYDTFFM